MSATFVDLKDVMRLRQVFKNKKWDENPNEEYVFEQFCHLFQHLTDEQKELIHELTENYIWLNSREYESRFNSLAKMVDPTKLKTCTTIYLFPIVKPGDDQKLKSGKHCMYYFRGSILSFNPLYQNLNLELIENYNSFQSHTFKNDGSEMLFLIDDFIGSGETFEDAWNEIRKNTSISESFISVLSLIIQNEAFEIISKVGLNIYHTEIRKRGISDHYNSPIKEEKIRIMDEIEEIIKPHFYSFGYKRSEALVTMLRTPDNTFPVFWMKYKLKGMDFIAPFFRP